MDRLTKRIIVVATLMLVALFSMATVSLRSGSASGVRQRDASPGYKQGGGNCPPVTTINGILGSGSQDYPATSGQQTGRILNGLGNITCGSSNPCSLNTATGSRAFDSYTFINSGPATACVTVDVTLDGCSVSASLQYSARLGSFDPANPCANYVGDAGSGFGGPNNNGSFSFNVPAGQTFVVVVNETDPGGAVGCAYTLTISGLACQAAPCPPTTAINGTLGSGSPDFPATSGQQTGRLVNGLGNITCGSSNPCSLNTPTGSRAFDAYTFNNPGATACVTVDFTFQGCASGALLQFSARIGSFDPANPCANYVGDGGAGFSGGSHSFSFFVPAGQNFVVVVNENDPAGAVGCAYSLTISGLSCEAPCPPATITGTIGKGSTDYPSTSGVQTGRVSQNGVDSTCAAPKTCPGIASAGVSFAFDSYQFVNDSSSVACVTFTFPTACGVNNAFHPVAYLSSFDPANPCTNYLGDIGHSINAGESGAFSVNVPANSTVVLVLHETGTQPGCEDYSFSVTGLPCQHPCAITCPSNITQPNDANQCGAVVNFSAPTTSGDCGAVTCKPASGSFFPKGTTTVTCTESDSSANCSFTVTVNDTQPPTITCPANITRSNDANQCGAVVTYPAPTVSDNCPGVGTPVCSPASGSFFPKGTTTVTCTVSDSSGNPASCTFTVTVNDTQPPSITCPANFTVSNDPNQCGAVVNYPPPTVSDNCPGVGVPQCSPASGSFFPVGTTTVTCTVADSSGNSATCTFTITVNDTQPPSITCPPNQTAVTNQNVCPSPACQVVNFPPPTASDNCPGVTVVCNPPAGSCFPVGITTVTCTATDAHGNTATCSFTVTIFDVVLQDDSDPSIIVLWNSLTGQYRFCCKGVTFTGVGKSRVQGCTYTLDHSTAPDRRVFGKVDKAAHAGNASIQFPAGTTRCTITDRNTLDDTLLPACQ